MRSMSLYLDDARIGRFRPEARRLHQGFVELFGDTPCAPELKSFLIDGVQGGDSYNKKLLEDLEDWRGLEYFKSELVREIGDASERNVVLASRSRSLMRLGMRMLFRNCRRCLTVDLCWPTYKCDLAQCAQLMGGDIVAVPLRANILDWQWDIDEVCKHIASAYVRHRCDGIMLPAVDSTGILLPISRIVEELRRVGGQPFVLIDAAQALGQVDLANLSGIADFLVTGTHKWVGSYFPLGVGMACNPNSQPWISNCVRSMVSGADLDDGLLRFAIEIENSIDVQRPETINLGPLFSGCGAWQDTLPAKDSLPIRKRNADAIAATSESIGWAALRPNVALRTGTLLLQSLSPDIRSMSPEQLAERFSQHGVQLTVYPHGIVRMAMPDTDFDPAQLVKIADVLKEIDRKVLLSC